jgi:hypothetical protein
MPANLVPGFLPSVSGFRFRNSFSRVPLRRIGIPDVLSVPIGDASNGLCGGMAFAARDFFELRLSPPADTAAPSDGPLFDYLVERLFDSFNLPLGPARYLELMNPVMQNGETFWSRLGLAPHGRAWRMARQEWPRIRAEIDGGHPSPLGLVRVRSTNPFALKENHQVLAFGYDLEGSVLTLRLYDPNRPGRDDVTLSLDMRPPLDDVPIATAAGSRVFSFFRVAYTPATPPPGH